MALSAVGLDAYATMDATTWGALALVLTALGGALTWVAWKRRGLAAAVRGLAWTLVPLALWLTGTLKLAASIVADVSHWAVHFAFSPVVWAGIVLAGVAVGLFLVSAIMRTRGIGVREGVRASRPSRRSAETVSTSTSKRAVTPKSDDIEGFDEIEAILKKHGI